MNTVLALLNFNAFKSAEGIRSLLLMMLVLVISLSFHEVAHGYIAHKLGDDTALLSGRLTMNPASHIDPMGAICFLFAGFGWARPVPVNPTRFRRKHSMKTGMVLVSLAGPLANILLAFLAALVFHIVITVQIYFSVKGGVILALGLDFLQLMYLYNVVLAVFNLLPFPPLDGWKIASAFLPQRTYFAIMRYERYIGLAMMAIILLSSGVILGTLIQELRKPFDFIIMTPIQSLFGIIWRAIL